MELKLNCVTILLIAGASNVSTTYNMNGDYVISNPNYDSHKKFSTSYDSYPNIEYFDVYSPPISTR